MTTTLYTVAVATFNDDETVAIAFATATHADKITAIQLATAKVPAPVTIVDIIEHTEEA